jgi:hypothetical protein
MEKKQTERNRVPCKLGIGGMRNGLLNESFGIRVLPLGQKMDPGVIAPRLI